MSKIKLIPAANLVGEIEKYAKTAATLQTRTHVLACSVLQHYGQNKDIRIVLKFINAVPEMVRVNGLKLWFEAFAPIKFTEETAVYVKDGKFKLGDAMDKPFWKFKANEGVPYEAIDLLKYAQQQVKKLQKDQEKTGRDHSALIAVFNAMGATPAAN